MKFFNSFNLLIFLVLCILQVKCMSINGPALTRYDPCGLSIIHFDKITDGLWQGVVNFKLYPNLTEAEIEIVFDIPVDIYGGSQNTSLTLKDDWRTFVVKLEGEIPATYLFYLSMNNVEDNDSDVPTVSHFSLNNITLCNEAIKASQTIDSLNVTKGEKYKHICGRRSLNHTELISVRTEANAGDWPWHVAVLIKDLETDQTKYQCGGSIISRVAVVTAGHCVTEDGDAIQPQKVVIIAGIINHKDVNQIGKQTLVAREVVLHPNYHDEKATSDLAVIKVNKLRYTEYVQPICIWGPVYDKTQLFGQQATVVGFGRTEDNEPSDVLRSTYTVIQNDTTCIDYSPEVYEDLMNEFTFCAGYGPTSSNNPRNGDSGGGLMVPNLQPDHIISWFLRGVLSKCGVAPGENFCNPKYYVVYTDVGPHYGWLYHHSGLRFKQNIEE